MNAECLLRYRSRVVLGIFSALLLTSINSAETNVAPAVPVVRIDASRVLCDDFLGVGVQWSSYPWWDISEDDWNKVFRRVEYMRMPFARVMLDGFWYCRGFDADGDPVYDWETSYMQKLCRLLDWCQRNNAVVMLGEWGRPNGSDLDLSTTDPRWTAIVADCVEHLRNEKGFTCIKYYNLINEPHGSWSGVSWEDWKQAIGNLHGEFARRGLLEEVGIASPDGDRAFTTRVLNDPDLPRQTAIYDEHWYVFNREILAGDLERYTREQLAQMHEKDPGKHFFLGEIGLIDDKKNDQQMHVFKFWYGVSMADAAIQMIRGRMSGFMAWNLDDAMHFEGDGGESMNALSDTLPPDAYERRKIWGFWDLVGAEHGNPEAELMRPWFYTWSALSRAFPPGCETLACDATGIDRLRVTAARVRSDDRSHLSIAIVSNTDAPRRLALVVESAAELADLARYDYFDTDSDERVDAWPEVVDEQGRDIFPQPNAVLRGVDLREGLTVDLPSRGVVVLTTLEGCDPILLSE